MDLPKDPLFFRGLNLVQRNRVKVQPLRFCISKTFDCSPKKAVDDMSFSVSQDTVFAMLGPNGAGVFHSVIGCCTLLTRVHI